MPDYVKIFLILGVVATASLALVASSSADGPTRAQIWAVDPGDESLEEMRPEDFFWIADFDNATPIGGHTYREPRGFLHGEFYLGRHAADPTRWRLYEERGTRLVDAPYAIQRSDRAQAIDPWLRSRRAELLSAFTLPLYPGRIFLAIHYVHEHTDSGEHPEDDD